MTQILRPPINANSLDENVRLCDMIRWWSLVVESSELMFQLDVELFQDVGVNVGHGGAASLSFPE